MRTEDGYIIHKCLNGDSTAFGFLVDKYRESVYASAYDRLRNFHDAEDVTQEVFIKAYQKLRTLRRWDSFASWLYRITLNLCRDWIRAQSRRPDHEFIADQDPGILERHAKDWYRQELVLESLREALESLPEMYRQALTLHYLGGMTSAEIARFVGVSPGAIRMRLGKGRSLLKEEMLAMVSTNLKGQRLQAGFTFRIVEAVKRIKVHPMPRAASLPWVLSLAAGIIVTLMSLSPHLSILSPSSVPMGSPLPAEAKVLKTGEIPVDILEISQIPVLASKQLDKADMPAARAVVPTSAEAAEDTKGVIDHPAEEPGYYVIGCYAETPEKVEFARGWYKLGASDSGLSFNSYGTIGFHTTGRGPEPAPMFMAFRHVNFLDMHLRLSAPIGTEWVGESIGGSKWKQKVNTVVKSNRDTMTVPAGTFRDCLRLKTVIYDSEGTQEERDFVNGTRYMWFAPGAGLVKLEYYHNDSTTTNIELVSYSVSEKDKGYFPLDLGNRWTYEWTNGYRDHKVRETCAIISTNRNTAQVCRYLVRKGKCSEEEEIKEGWNLREVVKRECKLSDEELDVAVEPLLEWCFAEWKDGRLVGFDFRVPSELSNSYGQTAESKGSRQQGIIPERGERSMSK